MSVNRPRIAFVTNFVQHYRVETFRLLSERLDLDLFLYSDGREPYWLPEHGTRDSALSVAALRGFRIGRTYISPDLPRKLATGKYDAIVSGIVGRYSMPVAFTVAKAMRKPFVLWTGVWHRIDTPFHRTFHPVTRWIYRHASSIVVYGTHVRDFLVAEGVDPSRIFVAPHAIDNTQYRQPIPDERLQELRGRLGIERDVPVLVYVGRYVPEKGLDVLLEALSSLGATDRQFVTVFVGAGRLEGWLRAESERLGLEDAVRFMGYVPPDGVPEIMALADALVLPSRTTPAFKEPWGLVVNEAFNQATPVIASDCVGAASGGLVINGVTGVVFPEGDARALARSLRDLFSQDGSRAEMGRTAKSRVLAWSNESMVEGFVSAVQHAMRQNGRD